MTKRKETVETDIELAEGTLHITVDIPPEPLTWEQERRTLLLDEARFVMEAIQRRCYGVRLTQAQVAGIRRLAQECVASGARLAVGRDFIYPSEAALIMELGEGN